MVIIIVPELEFDDVELVEPAASIGTALSLLAGSADPGDEPPKNRKIATTHAKHRNLITRLNVPSSHPGYGALNSRDLFSQKNLSQQNTCFLNLTSVINVPSNHLGQDASSHTLRPL